MIATEAEEQFTVIEFLEVLKTLGYNILYTAIPNSTYTKSWSQKLKNKRTGLRAGFPDLFIIINSKPLTIEMKRVKGGVTSPEQKVWINELNQAGIPSFVCKGFLEAKEVIEKFL